MAETTPRERAKTGSGSSGAAPAAKTTSDARNAPAPPLTQMAANALGGLRQRLSGALAPRPAPAGAAVGSRPPRGGMMRFFIGMMVFVIGAQFLAYVLYFFDSKLKFALTRTRLAPPKTPIFGGLTLFLVAYILLIVGFYMALTRFGIIPRDPFGAKAQARARTQQRTTAATVSARPGTTRTRADRRQSPAVATGAKSGSGARSGKGASGAAQAKGISSARQGTPRVRPSAVSGSSDEAYERVRAAERARRRRVAKR